MSVEGDLLTAIRAILPPHGAALLADSALNDLYEAYVLTAVVEAAIAEGWDATLEDLDEHQASTALFRRSPGSIYQSRSGLKFTHFALVKPDVPPLEAHIGIKVTGKSDVEHECDIALLPKDTARFCRHNRVHPKSARLLLGIECKYYAGDVDLGLGRGFVGLATELSSQYGECHFVANTSSKSVMKMLARQKRQRHEHVRPRTGRFETLREACRHVLHSYEMRTRT